MGIGGGFGLKGFATAEDRLFAVDAAAGAVAAAAAAAPVFGWPSSASSGGYPNTSNEYFSPVNSS